MISTTEMPTQTFSFTAIFKDVSYYPTDKVDSPIDSGKFEFNGITWFLRLYPGGTTYSSSTTTKAADLSNASIYCGVYIYSSHRVRASYSVALKSNKGSDIKRVEKCDLPGGYGYGWSDFVSRNILSSNTSSYKQNDSVTFVCDITIIGAVQISANIKNNIPMNIISPMTHSYRRDIDQLMLDKSSTDLNIIVDDHSVPAHKLILHLRSPVFRTMLSSGMMESANNQIIISDFDYRVVKVFINFLYLDTCDLEVLTKHAKSLLAIAHKYDVKGLIQLCENHLIGTLTVDTAVELMKIGEMYGCIELKKCATDFIKVNCLPMIQKSKFYQCLTSEPSHDEVMAIAEMLK